MNASISLLSWQHSHVTPQIWYHLSYLSSEIHALNEMWNLNMYVSCGFYSEVCNSWSEEINMYSPEIASNSISVINQPIPTGKTGLSENNKVGYASKSSDQGKCQVSARENRFGSIPRLTPRLHYLQDVEERCPWGDPIRTSSCKWFGSRSGDSRVQWKWKLP